MYYIGPTIISTTVTGLNGLRINFTEVEIIVFIFHLKIKYCRISEVRGPLATTVRTVAHSETKALCPIRNLIIIFITTTL